MALFWCGLVFMVFSLKSVVFSEPSECILEEMVDGKAINIAFSRDIANVKADMIGAMYVRSPNYQTLLEDCLKMCCETEECNVATVDVTVTNSLDSNCFLVICQPLSQCEWEYQDRLTTATTNRKPPTTTPKSTTLTTTTTATTTQTPTPTTTTLMSTTTIQKVTTLGVKSTTNLILNHTQTTVLPLVPKTTNNSLVTNKIEDTPLASAVGAVNGTASAAEANPPATNFTTGSGAENSTAVHANDSNISTAPASALISSPVPAPSPAIDNSTNPMFSNETGEVEIGDNMPSNETILNVTAPVKSTSDTAVLNHTDTSNTSLSTGSNATIAPNVTQDLPTISNTTNESNVTPSKEAVTNVTVASNVTQDAGVITNASVASNVTQVMGVTNASSSGLSSGNESLSNKSLASPLITTVPTNGREFNDSSAVENTAATEIQSTVMELKNDTDLESNSETFSTMTNIKTTAPVSSTDIESENNEMDSTGDFDTVLGVIETILNDTMTLTGETESLQNQESTPNSLVSQDPSLVQPKYQILQHFPNATSAEDAAMNGTVYHTTVMKEMPQSTLIALICASTLGVVIFFVVAIVVGKKMYDGWQRRHYTKVDYLVNGMYN